MVNVDKLTEQILAAGEPLDADADEIRGVLSNKAVLRTLNLLMQEINGKMDALTKVDFSEENSRYKANQLSSEIAGMRRIFDVLVEVASADEKEDENHG